MTYNPEDITEQERIRNEERVRKEYNRALNGSYLVRLFRACRWKYFSNEIYRGIIDAFVIFGPVAGLLIAILIGYLLFSNYTGS